MLWVLTVDDKVKHNRVARCFLRDSIRTQSLCFKDCEVRHIKYINRTGKLNTNRISRHLSRGRDNIVCAEDVKYYDENLIAAGKFRSILCVNAALGVLCGMSSIPSTLRVGIYDPMGDHAQICESIMEYTDNLVAVTARTDIYVAESERLLWERGAVLSVSKKLSSLSDCNIIVAPSGIDRSFKVNPESVVFTNLCPFAQLKCSVYYRYDVELPGCFLPLCDEGIGSDILAAGLFTHYKIYSLGGLVPYSFHTKSGCRTKKEIISLLERASALDIY